MNRHVDVIDILRQANPVPPGSVVDQPLADDEDFRSELERNDAMSSTLTRTEAEGKAPPKWPKYLGAAAVLLVVVAVAVPLTLPMASPVDWGDVPAGQRASVEQVVEAVNGRDAEALASAFGPDGTFATYVDFRMRSGCCDSYPVDEVPYADTWMKISDAWGLEADLEACRSESAQNVRCQVRSRWENLQMELGEEWLFVFDGSELRSWGVLFGAPDPADPTMPMTYDDLASWQEWVEENHPEQAQRFFPERPTFGDLSIDGVAYESNVLRFDPAQAEAIRASIEEYVASR